MAYSEVESQTHSHEIHAVPGKTNPGIEVESLSYLMREGNATCLLAAVIGKPYIDRGVSGTLLKLAEATAVRGTQLSCARRRALI